MVQRLFAILSLILCVLIIFIGSAHWKDKIKSQEEKLVKTSEVTENKSAKKDGGTDKANNGNDEPAFTLRPEQLDLYTENLPKTLQDVFKKSYEAGDPVDIFLVGSKALGAENEGWSIQVKKSLEMRFGEDFVNIEIFEFDGTSTSFIEDGDAFQIAAKKPDIVLFEALTLEDNGLVTIDDSHRNIETFLENLQTENPDVLFILQPPNPIYNASYYPVQVEALKQFAATKKIEYIDHWKVWPDPKTEGILAYLDDESFPNEKGHELWGKVIKEYFGIK